MRHSEVMIAIVVAVDKNRVIGEGNMIPWHVRSDFIRLARLTRGNTVILGRKTYESMVWYYNKSGKKMPGSTYVVLTHDANYKPAREEAQVAASVAEALERTKRLGGDVFVIGGGSVFKEMLPLTDTIFLTEVQTQAEHPDAYFPELNPSEWREVSREHFNKNEHDDFDTEVMVLERR